MSRHHAPASSFSVVSSQCMSDNSVRFSQDDPTGHSERKRRRCRQKKRWEDNIKEWTGMDSARSTRATENRTKWAGIVAKSSVVPRRRIEKNRK